MGLKDGTVTIFAKSGSVTNQTQISVTGNAGFSIITISGG